MTEDCLQKSDIVHVCDETVCIPQFFLSVFVVVYFEILADYEK